jgi:hypothetical protein
VPLSTVVVNVEVPLAGVKREIEGKVPRRVGEERDADIGMAGRLEYTVDRGPFAVSAEGGALVVEAPLEAHARACARGSCYAGCDPQARVVARIPLRLDAEYKLRRSSVRIDVTRGCEIHALGGLMSLDVTPMLQQRLAQESRRLEASIDRELPDLRPQATQLWTELSRAQPLPLGACVVLAPEGLSQGPSSGTGNLARLRFAMVARPELRARCAPSGGQAQGAASAPRPLPPLRDDPALPPEGDAHVAIVLPADAAAGAMQGAAVDLGKARARIRRASGDPSALVSELSGEACGAVATRAAGAAWLDSGRAVHLVGVAPLAPDSARASSVGLDASGVAKAVEQAAIAVPIAADELRTLLPELARSLPDERVTGAATVSEARPEMAGLRAGDLVAVVRLRGAVTIRAK